MPQPQRLVPLPQSPPPLLVVATQVASSGTPSWLSSVKFCASWALEVVAVVVAAVVAAADAGS